ncbi:Beta-glucuronidase [Fulvia fulva]|uniref:Beta-glucuronidase n=1 Tax=Passalora fulva TaxID=5499 RepID=A0A9Q8LFW6_PASFU|nr:Beta-glucuronidase [Fulvia fulva]KAK4617270.1 hypothetical protein CLAFUR0_10472 [Fulvia fulva]UJO15893.1 Beta-glucuronidase [Fulvia fulva]
MWVGIKWELGNEPDLFKVGPPRRHYTWSEQDYLNEWFTWTTAIHNALEASCPDLATSSKYRYYAPSFAGAGSTSLGPNASNFLNPIKAWNSGFANSSIISHISAHNYIAGAESPGVTLPGTLMNHTNTIHSVSELLNFSRSLHNPHSLPFILGETNSLFRQGRPGLSNTFGAALWGVDSISGTNYRYQSWQPVDTNRSTKGTKAPYYGNIAVAALMGDVTGEAPKIANLPLEREQEAAYAAYVGDKLERIVVVNLMAWNETDYNEEYWSEGQRPVERYRFQVPKGVKGEVGLRRLMANGSDAISGVTFDGYSYNFELDEGRPVLLGNVTRGESARVRKGGWLQVEVPWSSAVMVDFGK